MIIAIRLQLLTTFQRNAFRFQVNIGDLNVGPEIEIRTFGLFNEAFAQLFTIVCMKTEVVVDWIVYERELTTDCFVLFEHERVETYSSHHRAAEKAGGTGANDQDIVHRVAQTVSLRSAHPRADSLLDRINKLTSSKVKNESLSLILIIM